MAEGVLVALGTHVAEPDVLTAVDRSDLHVVRRCVDIADLLSAAAGRQAVVSLVSADLVGLDADVVDQVQTHGVTVVGVVATSEDPDEALLRSLGITHVGSADDLVTLLELVTAAAASDRSPGSEDRSGEVGPGSVSTDPAAHLRSGLVVAVWGPTGAPGRSLVASSLSAALAGAGCQTLLVDADVYGGCTAIRLGVLDEASGLLAAARDANRGALQPAVLAEHARTVNPRLRVLTGLPRADRWPEVKAVLMGRIVETARGLAEFTVVDCGFSLERDEELIFDTAAPRRNGATFEVLERADVVLVVGGADPVGLSRLIRGIDELGAAVPTVRPWVVVNRLRPSLGWSAQDVGAMLRDALGPVRLSFLPDDPAAVDRALVDGRTLAEAVPDSRLAQAVLTLASELTDRSPSARTGTTPGARRLGRRTRSLGGGVRRRRAARDR